MTSLSLLAGTTVIVETLIYIILYSFTISLWSLETGLLKLSVLWFWGQVVENPCTNFGPKLSMFQLEKFYSDLSRSRKG